jgi:hypothetical protein
VCPNANCQDCEKRIPTQGYFAIFTITLIAVFWLWNPSPANAVNHACLVLINHGNRITSTYAGAWSSGSSFYNNRPTTLPLVRDYCHDAGSAYSYSYSYSWGAGSNVIATRAVSVPDNNDYTDYIQSWDMSQVANKLGCGATGAGGNVGFPGINQVVSMLPASPASVRIPTLITKMAGENSLAGNLAIELYSGAWQFLGILTSFKLFKIFFKGG